jgi:hypothetical protein
MGLNKEDRDRLEELQAKIWAMQIRRTMQGSKDPGTKYDIIEAEEIEKHGGRIDKALRLLSQNGDIQHHGTVPRAYGGPTHTYRVLNLDKSQALAKEPEFKKDWHTLHGDVFSESYSENPNTMPAHGYRTLSHLSNTEVLWVWWHQDDYDIIEDTEGSGKDKERIVSVYPKALQETRIKAILRAIAEHHFQYSYRSYLEQHLNLPTDSLKRKGDHFDFKLRNFAYYPANFSIPWFQGTNGFMEEYTHYRDYFSALVNGLQTYMKLVESAGGCEEIIRRMRKASIEKILHDSPLHISYEESKNSNEPYKYHEDDDTYEISSWRNKWISIFVLGHSEYFDYDTLYGTDETLQNVYEDDHLVHTLEKVMEFTPDAGEVSVIKNMGGACQPHLPKMTSETSTDTSESI